MIVYFVIGVCWLWYLEWFSVNHLKPPFNNPWNWIQRLYTIIFWPVSLGHWIKGFIDQINKNN